MKENYLKRIPERNDEIIWREDEEGKVTLEIQNRGFFNRFFQIIFNKPKISYIHLDEMGSFIWKAIDEKSDVIEIGNKVADKFGESAKPLYERLAKYFAVLESYNFILMKKY